MVLLQKYDGVDYALAKARGYVDEGRKLLQIFPDGEGKSNLLSIADYIINRSF